MPGGVFICHASQDAHVARQIVTALEAGGVPCWIAPRDITPGENYTQSILHGLAAAPALVLVFSAAADRSPHVRRELEVAVGTDTAIVPVRLEEAEPSPSLRYFIGTSQWLDAIGLAAEHWQPILVGAVRRILGLDGAPAVPRTEAPDMPPRSETPIAPVPRQQGRTWGREALCQQVRSLIEDGHRLVTLTGLGGIGKTRVAVEIAAEMQRSGGEVHFLAPTERTTPDQLVRELADALRCVGQEPLQALGQLPDHRSPLVVLDNLEVVPGAADQVSALLEACPGLSVLATSRLPFRLREEHVVPVPPLEVPHEDASSATITASPAVRLLAEAAKQTSTSFRLEGNEGRVADLCRLLDGVPLALELAAARLKVLGLERVHASLQSSLDLLTTASPQVPERQRALATTIEWSFDRLTHGEGEVCRRLAVFEGTFTLAAVEAICSDLDSVVDALAGILDVGLLRATDSTDEVHYEMPATVRTFVRQRLDSVAEHRVRDALASHLLGQVRTWADRLDTAEGPAVLTRFEHAAADVNATIDGELQAGHVDTAVELALASGRLWVASGRLTDALERTRRVLAGVAKDSPESARLHAVAGRLAYHLDDLDTATAELQSALALGERLADEATTADARCYLGATLLMTGRTEEGAELARRAFEDSERLGLYPLAAEALSVLAISHAVRQEYDDERRAHERRLEIVRRQGDLARTADTLNTLAEIALDEDDTETARSYAAESLELASGRLPLESRDATITLARAAALAGRRTVAAELLRDALMQSERIGHAGRNDLAVAQCLRVGGCLAASGGQAALAVRLFAAAHTVSPSPSGTETPVERDLATGLEVARAELGEARADREWTLGAALPLTTMLTQLDEALGLAPT